MANRPVIETPQGKAFVNQYGRAQLVWNPNFKPKWTRRYSQTQIFVDSEVLRLSEPFTPLQTGLLVKSGTLGTDIGSGTVSWIAPYAKRQYYKSKTRSETGNLRGGFWFDRMKAVHGEKLIADAKKAFRKNK